MKKCYCVLSAAAAGLLTAAPAFSLAGPDAAKGAGALTEVQQPVKLNPTKRVFEIEVPVKSDGALLGNVGIKITPADELFVDAKLLKKYLAKVIKPDILTAALAVPAPATQVAGGTTLVGKKAPGAAASSMIQLASQQMGAVQIRAISGRSRPAICRLRRSSSAALKSLTARRISS